MLKQPRYFFAVLLLWPSYMAEAQGYAPEQAAPSSSVLIYVVLIGIGGVALFYLYRFVSRRVEETPQSPLRMQPKTQPAPKPISVPSASNYVPGSIFISYRRDDSADITGRIYDRLIQYFSREIVFKDVDSIPLGIDFRQHLEGALSQCRVLLAIVGDQWLGREIAEGKRRIDDPRDHLRLELEVALSRNIPVIPVLVRKASIPAEDALPPSLRSMAYAMAFRFVLTLIFTGIWTDSSKESNLMNAIVPESSSQGTKCQTILKRGKHIQSIEYEVVERSRLSGRTLWAVTLGATLALVLQRAKPNTSSSGR